MKRIAFIIGSMHRGGAERVISILADDYISRGWQVDIIMLLFGDVDYDISDKIRILDFSGNVESRIRRLPYWLKSIRHYYRKNKSDVILSFAARINIITMTALFGTGANIIISERNDPRYDTRGNFARVLSKIYYPKARKVIFQTQIEQEYYNGIQNGVIIPNPISVTVYADEFKKKRIVSVGRLEKQKNHKMLIQSFANIADDYPEYSLEIFGQGSLKYDLLDLIESLRLEERVILNENIPNIHESIRDAELFIISSNYEGLSNAMLEAMMMGLPVISTNVSGASDYIKNGENGLIIPVGDGKAMEHAMRKMLSDDFFRKQCSKKAMKISELVSKDVVLKQWHEVTG